MRVGARSQDVLWSAASLALVLLVWEAIVRLFRIPPYLLPGPAYVAAAVGEHWRSLVTQSIVTMAEVLAGFLAAALVAIPLAMLVVVSPVLERLIYPPMVATQSIPKIALAPLFIVWFGFGISSKVIIAGTVAFFPVLVNVIVGLKTVDAAKLDLMRSLRASRWQTFRLVTFPNALPFVFAGLDIAIVFSVLGAIVGEFVGSQKGLGNLILQFNFSLDVAGVFAVLILLSVMGVVLHLVMQAVQRHVIFWAEPDETISA